MKVKVTVCKVDKKVSLKGNPYLTLAVKEEGSLFPMNINVYRDEQVQNPPAIGSEVILATAVDYRYNGVLTVIWPISK